MQPSPIVSFRPPPALHRAPGRAAGARGSSIAVLIVALALGGTAVLARAEIIAQWNFNGPLTGTLLPSYGEGALRAVGVGSVGFGSGAVAGGSSDPVTTNPPNYAWQVSGFPAQGSGTGLAGVQGAVDTTGFTAISVAFDFRPTATSARHQQIQVSLDGVSFIDRALPLAVAASDAWVIRRTFDLGAIGGAGDNPLFAFRIVSAFAPGTQAYQATSASSNYATQGTWRFDMLTVSGERLPLDTGSSVAVVPLPASIGLLVPALSLLGWVAGRRRSAVGAGCTL